MPKHKIRSKLAAAALIIFTGLIHAPPLYADEVTEETFPRPRIISQIKSGIFVSGGYLLPELQSFDYSGKETGTSLVRQIGFAILTNYFFRGNKQHSFSLDAYTFTEDHVDASGPSPTQKFTLTAFYLGYRYHHKSGFYAGAGFLPITAASIELQPSSDHPILKNPLNANPGTAMTLGYLHSFASDTNIGVHLLNSFPTYGRSAINNDLVEEITLRSVGLSFGYTLTRQ